MQLIRDVSDRSYCFINDKKQCIFKISKTAIPCFNTDKCFYFLFHDVVIKVEISKDDAVYPSLNLYVNKKQVLHFMDETPENEACLSVYDKLPMIISVPSAKELSGNKWQFIDYRDEKDVPRKILKRPKKIKQPKIVPQKMPDVPKNKEQFCPQSVYRISCWPKIDLNKNPALCFGNERG